jgi:hypothetical protein
MTPPHYRIQTELRTHRARDEGGEDEPPTVWFYDGACYDDILDARTALNTTARLHETEAFKQRWHGHPRHNTGNFRIVHVVGGVSEIIEAYVHEPDAELEAALRDHLVDEATAAQWRMFSLISSAVLLFVVVLFTIIGVR